MATWKDTIGKITVIVENNRPYDYIFGKSETWKRIADNKWQAIFYDVEPEYRECFTFHTHNILHDTGPKCFPAYFPYIKQKAQIIPNKKIFLFLFFRIKKGSPYSALISAITFVFSKKSCIFL